MENQFSSEVAQIESLRKQTLQKLIAVGSQYINIWADSLDTSKEIKEVNDRQRQREKEGFSPNNRPDGRSEYRTLNERAQLEERQRYEKLMFEYQKDNKTLQALNQDWRLLRSRAEGRVNLIQELHSVFSTLSNTVYLTSGYLPGEAEQDKEQGE